MFPLISAVDMKPFKTNITFNPELTLFIRFFALCTNKILLQSTNLHFLYNSWFLAWPTGFSLRSIWWCRNFFCCFCQLFNIFWSCFWFFFFLYSCFLYYFFSLFFLFFLLQNKLSYVLAAVVLSTYLISPFSELLDKSKPNLLLAEYLQLIH